MKRELTNRTRMSALRKIQQISDNSVDVKFATASHGDNAQWSIHVSSMKETLGQEAVMVLEQEKCAIENLNLLLKCEKKFRGAVIGKGGKGIRDIATTAGSGTRIDCVDAKGGFVITSFEERAFKVAKVNLERRIEECSMLTNKRRSQQSKPSPPSQKIFGSRFACLIDENAECEADDEDADGETEENPQNPPPSAHQQEKRKPEAGAMAEENPQKLPPSAHQQEKRKLQAGVMADSSGPIWTTVRRKKSRAAKRRPKPRFKRDGGWLPPNVGRFVPIRTLAHDTTATGKRKPGNSSHDRMAKSNQGPIAKGIANQQPIASSAVKRLATAKASPRPVRPAAGVKAIADFVSKVGIGRTYRGVVSCGASQPHQVARPKNATARLGL